ncbi:30S ribosomal protein S8 [Candidatus Acetothermia bacterium]|nr:30S ribosomal protein S8 [Candidatus Acetothermia bacterium]MCI2427597.1 30S ribosomal protein S8 [Candidatus Acetothermia bacterium]MCI2428209.1 30S ribosomal protein S8 [Candidatus Acetothermia bacterium]
MTIEDPIADMLTRIRNANAQFHPRVMVPYSKPKETIAQILVAEGYLQDYKITAEGVRRGLEVMLKYKEKDGKQIRVLTGLRLISRLSQRVYVSKNEIPRSLDGLGLTIVSTSQGILSAKEAQARGIGGEVICMVW